MGELSKENHLQQEAFELYYSLGDKRSHKLVAEKIGRTERTIAGWSRSLNWVDRVKQREIEDAKNEALSTGALNSQTTEVKTRYRLLLNNLIKKTADKIAKGELSIRNIQDLERVIKLDLLLMGEATDRQDNSGAVDLSPADRARLKEIADLLSGKK
jgi:hypothetical protein